MIKLYVNQTTEKTVDGDQLQVVDVLPSQTEQVDRNEYIISWKLGSELI